MYPTEKDGKIIKVLGYPERNEAFTNWRLGFKKNKVYLFYKWTFTNNRCAFKKKI